MVPTIGALMTDIFIGIDHAATVREATRKMKSAAVGSLLVERDHEFVGIMTEPDIVRKVNAMERDADDVLVSEIMTSPIITIDAHTSVREAVSMMADHEIRHLVVTRGGKISGLLSVRDVLGYMKNILATMNDEQLVGAR